MSDLHHDSEKAQHVFQLPPKLAAELGVRTIALIELTADDEIMASKRARADQATLLFELSKAALHSVDGKRLSLADGSADRWWSSANPKVRALIVSAYNDVHSVQQEDASAFLKSRTVTV